ncbi:type II toxin-antitoxin system RelE/ParE family toxin [Sphingobium sp. YR768]|uniref:type II toxin-antitoxin system RelE/ParE family toxin n=1 Tax=Sphingobium sp. YR768 TaxID=1884365 RepID=UPI0008B4D50F|nr:type II toxin-antitoxin system RelE/ParE family toxin [Sphingobium sp. YR768]SEQ52378.1 Plasmid stabilization system protein ParE [Sphingobium sp. YR768]
MKIVVTGKATADLVRLHDHLKPVAPDAAARIVQPLARAPSRLIDYPRLGERLDTYNPRQVRRIIIGHYEMRYEITGERIIILRLWHGREDRASGEPG